ncbi:hypothetical protein ACHAXM_005158 [Skeletonema potamos]|jgi:hypothetical protein
MSIECWCAQRLAGPGGNKYRLARVKYGGRGYPKETCREAMKMVKSDYIKLALKSCSAKETLGRDTMDDMITFGNDSDVIK